MNEKTQNTLGGTLAAVVVVGLIVGCVFLCIVGAKGCANYERSQARKDAENKVKIAKIEAHNRVAVTGIEIKRQHEYAETVKANTATVEAERHQRVVRAEGIEKAQKIIAKTLTAPYIQWEAIEAQKAIATSGKNNTVIYVPSGTNGTPLITAGAATGK